MTEKPQTIQTAERPPPLRAARGSVLVVDDEQDVLDVVARYLINDGFDAQLARDGREALRIAGRRRPDLAVLDIVLPDLSGFELMRRLREAEQLPIILLTAKDTPDNRVNGLESGADDYLPKPFSPSELVARVEAVLRRARRSPELEPRLVFDGLSIDPRARQVAVDGEDVKLTKLEYDLLLFLARSPLRAVTRSELMENVWPEPFYAETSTVAVHMRRLRTKIEMDASAPQWLQTVRGVGYRFHP